MSDPFIGEIRPFAFNYAPMDWAMCSGQSIAYTQNPALYAIIGTTFGGSPGRSFNLPNLQGQVPVHQGTGIDATSQHATFAWSTQWGEESESLTSSNLAGHNHVVNGAAFPSTGAGTVGTPTATSMLSGVRNGANAFWAWTTNTTPNDTLGSGTVGVSGGAASHENRQPYLALNFCISLSGYFPVNPGS
ncbi:MAG: phage tail protein [Alphaproteobacteria bacterium]